jgi:DNA processing protein
MGWIMMESLQGAEAGATLDEDGLGWLALVLTPGMGPRRVLEAMRGLERPGQIFGLALTELEGLRMPAGAAQWVFEGRARAAAEAEWEKARKLGAAVVSYDDALYPERLKEIYDPPPVLWVRGEAGLLGRASIAVVGTRKPTPYGTGMAERLSRDLAARGLLIVSGMARGVDTAAHKGALAAGKPTVAVWGTGADVVYPKENARLAAEIVETGGAVVSELPLGTFPAPQNFPRRNRILSGLSVGVLVVEASENSGTRVTARCAADQGRDVYAVPGNVTNPGSWTPNTLIKQGAQLTATWEDVWESLASDVKLELEGAGESKMGAAASLLAEASPEILSEPPLRGREAVVFGVLRQDAALQMDEILDRVEAQLSSAEVFTALFELELAGRIRSLPGKNYVRSF